MTKNCSGNLAICLFEFCSSIVESNDLSGTDECEVKRVKEQHHIFPWIRPKDEEIQRSTETSEVRKLNSLEFTIHQCCGTEIWGWFLNEGFC